MCMYVCLCMCVVGEAVSCTPALFFRVIAAEAEDKGEMILCALI